MTFSGVRHNFTVARLVYHCFVQSFDLADDTTMIVSVDQDNLNIRPDNLRAVSRSQRQLRIVDRQRFRSPLLDISQSDKDKIRKKIVRTRQRQVSQYGLTGKRMRTYKSLVHAQQTTGISNVCIAGVAHGKTIRAGGYFWRWGKEDKIDVEAMLADRRQKNRQRNGMKVTQYTLSGHRVARYPSLQDAKDASGAGTQAIGLVVRGIYKSANNYFWKKGYGPEKIDLTGYLWGKESRAAAQCKRVGQYNQAGKLIRTFDSVKEAAAAIRVGSATLSAACNGYQHTCRGWRWKFV